MAETLTLEDDGYMEVTIKDKDGSAVTKRLDLYETHNALADLSNRNKEARVFHQSVREFLQQKGFPACSDRLADRFAVTVFDKVAQLKAADGGDAKTRIAESIPSN
jgi:hypothetical protein